MHDLAPDQRPDAEALGSQGYRGAAVADQVGQHVRQRQAPEIELAAQQADGHYAHAVDEEYQRQYLHDLQQRGFVEECRDDRRQQPGRSRQGDADCQRQGETHLDVAAGQVFPLHEGRPDHCLAEPGSQHDKNPGNAQQPVIDRREQARQDHQRQQGQQGLAERAQVSPAESAQRARAQAGRVPPVAVHADPPATAR